VEKKESNISTQLKQDETPLEPVGTPEDVASTRAGWKEGLRPDFKFRRALWRTTFFPKWAAARFSSIRYLAHCAPSLRVLREPLALPPLRS